MQLSKLKWCQKRFNLILFENTIFKSRFITLTIVKVNKLFTYNFNTIRYIAKLTMFYKCTSINCRAHHWKLF